MNPDAIKLASRRRRPRRVARKLWRRFGIAHHRDVPRGWHCPDCLPVFWLDDEHSDLLSRCMQHSGIEIVVEISGDLGALDDAGEPTADGAPC
jgi:hypothetical protein